MYIDIIDTENTGLEYVKSLTKGNVSTLCCFTKNTAVIRFCSKNKIHFVSNYPLGKNQADFKIISHVSVLVSKMSNIKRNNSIVRLHTSDKGLSLALQNECDWLGITYHNPKIEEVLLTDFDEQLMTLLEKKISFDEILTTLNARAPFLLKKIADLHARNKIKIMLQAA